MPGIYPIAPQNATTSRYSKVKMGLFRQSRFSGGVGGDENAMRRV